MLQMYRRTLCTVSSVPGHCNKANTAIKWVAWRFWFPRACKSLHYTVVYYVCNSIVFKKQCTYPNFKILLETANIWVFSASWSSPVEGLASVLLPDQGGGCLRVGWLWQFLKKKEAGCISGLLLSWLIALQHAMLLGSIAPTAGLPNLKSVLSNPAVALQTTFM